MLILQNKPLTGVRDSLADLIVDGETNFASFANTIAKGLAKIALNNLFTSTFGDAIKGSDSLKGLGKLFGLQRGGSFQVGAGTGLGRLDGNDNRLIAFRAQDGEQVTVTPRNNRENRQQSAPITIIQNITTPNPQAFPKNSRAVANEFSTALRRANA